MLTQINSIKQRFKKTQEAIMFQLQISETQYANFLFKKGTAYLQAYIPQDPAGIDMLVDSRVFWAWWRLEWMLRDEQFIASNYTGPVPLLRRVYASYHRPDELASEISPNGVVMAEGYAKMIGCIIENY
jgi:hypothetical protein